ncbi:hypothetical protein F5884DRAFT_842916 [Xylogone sp. PMI_703]|nr:hypothetical protein F5884DRAFT_842916 [Xylogone sp. PMI_703]
MPHKVLVTGGSGYLGGTLLSRLAHADLPSYAGLYGLVRTDAQAEAIKRYGADPLMFNPYNEVEVWDNIVKNDITIVYFLIDAASSESQIHFIKALEEVKRKTGENVHFLHTSGAKMFSSHAGAPTADLLLDTDPNLYDIQRNQRAKVPRMGDAVKTNCDVIDAAENHGVRSYIFVPCIVYGRGEGFGNKISIQTVAIVQAAKATGRVYKVDDGVPTWPVCHVIDNTTLYLQLLHSILAGNSLGYGKNGYYLAASGSIAWDDLYANIATSLVKRNVIEDSSVIPADASALEGMGKALGCPKEYVQIQIGGLCTFTAEHGKEIGWKPQFSPTHILETADEEVDLILQNTK